MFCWNLATGQRPFLLNIPLHYYVYVMVVHDYGVVYGARTPCIFEKSCCEDYFEVSTPAVIFSIINMSLKWNFFSEGFILFVNYENRCNLVKPTKVILYQCGARYKTFRFLVSLIQTFL